MASLPDSCEGFGGLSVGACNTRYSLSGQFTLDLGDDCVLASGNTAGFGSSWAVALQMSCSGGSLQSTVNLPPSGSYQKSGSVDSVNTPIYSLSDCAGAQSLTMRGGGYCGGAGIRGDLMITCGL